jgi:hypothetical protein
MPSSELSTPVDPAQLKQLFYFGQIVIGALMVGAYWVLRKPKYPDSGFKTREGDPSVRRAQAGARPALQQPDPLAEARMRRHEPLRLAGIRIDGEPHEILGIAATSGTPEIQRAYRELMKRYHPDIVGRPGSREWTDAQRIAEAINRAKEEMLKRASSGRHRA